MELNHFLKKLGMMLSLVIFLSIFTLSGCHAVKTPPPEEFFHGSQLALAQAIYRGDMAGVKQLAAKTDLNKPGDQDMTILFFALQTAYGVKQQQLNIISELVRQGADPLQKVPDAGSVAGISARSDSPLYMNALLEGGMSPDAIVGGDTPVIFGSASEHSFNVLKLLVSKGADVNKRDTPGANVLIEALSGWDLDVVEWLLNHGADPTLVTVNGWQFGNMLENIINKSGSSDRQTQIRLEEIRKLAVSKGMKWPPQKY